MPHSAAAHIRGLWGLQSPLGKNGGLSETFTVRKISGGIGVERIFPLHCPSISEIEVKRLGKVRRAKLYYLRKRSGKSARIKERREF